MKLFDLIQKELIGKYVFSKGNTRFKVSEVFEYYDDLKNHYNTKENIRLSAILLVGKDEKGQAQELVLANHKLIDLYYSE